MYEIFEHTADLGIHVEADDLNALFAEAGRGLFSVIVEDLDGVRALEGVEFKIQGTEPAFLLVDFLGELLFTFESSGLLLSEFSVGIDDKGLAATASGEPFDASRHQLEHEVKAITYHGLCVERTDNRFAAQVILDI